MDRKRKQLEWIGPAKEELRAFPDQVRQNVGYALFEAERGEKPASAKPLKGFGGASVLEVIDDYRGDTYRAVYTVRFSNAIYVLCCFQKKSHYKNETPKEVMKLIEQRLQEAEEKHGKHK